MFDPSMLGVALNKIGTLLMEVNTNICMFVHSSIASNLSFVKRFMWGIDGSLLFFSLCLLLYILTGNNFVWILLVYLLVNLVIWTYISNSVFVFSI